MNSNPQVSIVVPVYNSREYIEHSLVSLCEQKYKNIELVIVNDGTEDDSMEIVNQVLLDYQINHQIINQKNSGLPSARNVGINYANGEYVCFIDSDDMISNSHIEKLVKCVNENNLRIACSNFENVNLKNRAGSFDSNQEVKIYTKNELFEFFVKRKPPIHCCTLIVQMEHLKKNNIFFNEKLRYGEDVEYMWRFFSTVEELGYVNNKSYKYLNRPNSIMTTVGVDKGIILSNEFKRTLTLLKNQHPKYNKYYDWAYYRTMLGWMHGVSQNSNYKIFEYALENINVLEMCKNLISFPDFRIKLLAVIIKISPHIFYRLLKRGKKHDIRSDGNI